MVEYNPPVSFGSPASPTLDNTHELQNFSVVRDADNALMGFAVSDAEIKAPVLQVTADPLTKRLWLHTAEALFFIPLDELSEDINQTLTQACQKMEPVKVYSLPIDEDEHETLNHR